MPEKKSLDFVLPSDEEAMGFIANLLQSSNTPAETQISFRLWLTELLQEAGRVATSPPPPAEGDDPDPEHPVQ